MRDSEFTPPTPERIAKGDIAVEESPRGGRLVRSFSNPLDFYLNRSHITPEQHAAGSRLHQLWYYSQNPGGWYVLMRYGEVSATVEADCNHLLGVEYRRAMDSVRGNVNKQVVYNVCCVGEAARRGRMMRLRSGLDDLAKHFGY